MATLTTNQTGASAEYLRYSYGAVKKTETVNNPSLLDFRCVPSDSSFVKLLRGAYITLTTNTYGVWFTGFVTNDAELEYIGTTAVGGVSKPQFGYIYQATSDEYLLNLKPIGIVPPFVNTTQGAVIKYLVKKLSPAGWIFDVTGIEDGQGITRYVVDPTKKFSEVVKEFADAANFQFRVLNKVMTFTAQSTGDAGIQVDGTSKHFTPSRLTLRPVADPVINDAIVIGDVEPQTYFNEYFVGDGVTASFQLVNSVYGVDSSVLLDDDFSSSTVDNTKWTIVDAANAYLQPLNGFLNVLGGNNAGGFDIYLQSLNLLPLEGNLRLTHGEYDFVSASDGIIASLWSQNCSSTLTNCIYGLRLTKSGTDTVINPIVNGVVDTTQSFTVDYTKRYNIRTLFGCDQVHRLTPDYSYRNATGDVGTYGGTSKTTIAHFDTVITTIDISNGDITGQTTFSTSGVTLTEEQTYGYYCPVVSNDLHLTVTGVTLSSPMQTSLEVKDGAGHNFAGASFGTGPSTLSLDYTPVTGQAIVVGVFQHDGTGPSVTGISDTAANTWVPLGAYAGFSNVFMWICYVPQPVATTINVALSGASGGRYAIGAAQYPFVYAQDGGIVGDSHGTLYSSVSPSISTTNSTDLLIVFGSAEFTVQGAEASVEYPFSTDGASLPSTTAPMAFGSQSVSSAGTYSATFSLSTTTNWAAAAMVALKRHNFSSPHTPQLSGTWNKKLMGPNEVDSYDGLAPLATIIDSASGVTARSTVLGAPIFNSGQASLTFFKDTSKQITQTPAAGNLIHLSYRVPGAALGRVQNRASQVVESAAFKDDGLRTGVLNSLSPLPHTAEECEQAAAAYVASYDYQHYEGTYSMPSGEWFSGEPHAGTILKFVNLSGVSGFPSALQAEAVTEVQTTLDGTLPDTKESFTHTLTFGPVNRLAKFLGTLKNRTNTTVIQDTAEIPDYVDIESVGLSHAIDVTTPKLTGWTTTALQFDSGITLPANTGLEVRYSDDSWGPDDAGNLITRSTTSTFSVPRNIRGKICYMRLFDKRNVFPWSDDLTSMTVTPASSAATLTTVFGTNPEGHSTKITLFTPTGPNPFVDWSSGLTASGTSGCWSISTLGAVGTTVTLAVYFLHSDSTTDPRTFTTSFTCNGGWQRQSVPFTWDTSFDGAVYYHVESSAPVQLCHASTELGTSSETVYCKTTGSPYGALSRYAAGVRVEFPLIPPAPFGKITYPADLSNVVLTITDPTVMVDVWGYEIRASDNTTIVSRLDLVDSTYNPVVTLPNSVRNPQFYLYSYNLLGEYSIATSVTATIPTPTVSNLAVDDATKSLTWSSSMTNPLPAGASYKVDISGTNSQYGGLMGAWADGAGNVITPLYIGSGATLTVPAGVNYLQLGVNDDTYADNTGSWTIAVNGTNHTVNANMMPWVFTGGINAQYSFGVNDGVAPLVIAVTPGASVSISYVSGTIVANTGVTSTLRTPYAITSITQPSKATWNFAYFLQSSAVGSSSAGTNVTMYYADKTAGASEDADLLAAWTSGKPVYLCVSYSTDSGASYTFGPTTVQMTGRGLASPPGNPHQFYYFTFTVPNSSYSYYRGSNGSRMVAGYQRTLFSVTTSTSVTGHSAGDSAQIQGTSLSGYNATWTLASITGGTQFDVEPGLLTVGGGNSPIYGSSSGGELVFSSTGDLCDASGYTNTDGTASGTTGTHYPAFYTLWTVSDDSASVQTLHYTLPDSDFYNTRYMRVLPIDQLGPGTPSSIIHSYTSSGVSVGGGVTTLFPVELPIAIGTPPPTPAGFPVQFADAYVNASYTAAMLNLVSP